MGWILIALRALQIIFSFVVLGLSADVAHWYNSDTLTAPPPQINFLIFVPTFSLISSIYLLGTTHHNRTKRYAHPYAVLAMELTNMVFYFAGFVAISTFLSHLLFCRGNICMAARADAGVSAVSWVLWSASSGMSVMAAFRGRVTGVKVDKETKEANVAVHETSSDAH
ncbi:membrane-associating domain-containing protein [Calycina marina]|uniref:Membrane-associating domain-containing protein n=1 Tax=Calycina marina TaxID=1763456 RepID=A0A9P7YWS5_9HELO|nr:membrane-associating domain-containing protein [Calycina marina]